MGRPFQMWRCSQSPPSMAWIIPSRRFSYSRRGKENGDACCMRPHHNPWTCSPYWQAIKPSIVAGAMAGAPPMNSPHRMG